MPTVMAWMTDQTVETRRKEQIRRVFELYLRHSKFEAPTEHPGRAVQR
jgi:hypothetical protein